MALGGLSWSMLAAAEPGVPLPLPRKPVVVKPVFVYDVYTPHPQTSWRAFVYGCLAGIVPWIAIGIYFVGSVTSGEQVPNFVYAIYVSLFLFFNVFAINMILQYKKIGRWQDYIYGEKVYIVLSLVAKSLLAWQVFFGTLQPN
jgi:hypothetical protein